MLRSQDKPLVWLKGEVRTPPFSQPVRIEAGLLLRRLQKGEALDLPHSRPMPSIGPQCHELRLNDQNQSWRIVYFLAADAVVILDVFSKKTTTTPKDVIANCKRRLEAYIRVTTVRGRKGQ
jgi:phage-related protein